MKKKVLIIANFVSLPNEGENCRFTYIANKIDKTKFDVEIITSNFYHTNKTKRNTFKENLDYKVTLIDEPGYTKNVSLKRFYSHFIFAKNVKNYIETIEKPDVIYCAIPSLDVAKISARYAEKNNIKFIIDVQDLWPEAFKMVLNIPVLSDIIFYPMKKTADFAYSRASSIIAVSETYKNRATSVNKKSKNNISVYLGTDLDYFDKLKNENKIVLNDDMTRIAYVGTLGHSYDIKCVIEAIKVLNEKGLKNILFVIIGDGPLKEDFKNYAKEKNVECEFTGMLEYGEMIGKLSSCDIAVNSITKNAAQSIVNKVGDYAASSLPVINNQENEEYKNLVNDYQIGFNVANSNPYEMAEKIEILYKDKELCKKLGKNNRKLAEEKFNRKESYKEIIKIIED